MVRQECLTYILKNVTKEFFHNNVTRTFLSAIITIRKKVRQECLTYILESVSPIPGINMNTLPRILFSSENKTRSKYSFVHLFMCGLCILWLRNLLFPRISWLIIPLHPSFLRAYIAASHKTRKSKCQNQFICLIPS
jgi:hypothetical protein